MLQRIQTVYMLLAALCMVVAIASFGRLMTGFLLMADVLVLTAAGFAAAFMLLALVLTIVAICTFKRRMRQRRLLAWANAISVLVAVLAIVPLVVGGDTAPLLASGLPMLLAVVFNVFARRAIMRDERLVRSADRIR